MHKDDLPPRRKKRNGETFASELGSTLGRALWLFALMALIGAIIWAATRIFGS
jgi:hypothetical protein